MNIENCWYKSVCQNECNNFCLRFAEMNYLTMNSGIPEKRQVPQFLYPDDSDYDSFVELSDIKENIQEFVLWGKNLYICSKNTGNGKTSWAIKLMLRYFNDIWAGNGFRTRGLFVHVPTLLLALKNFDNPPSKQYLENLNKVDLVCWDDIASTKLSQYDTMQLLNYIDSRILNDKSNIFTGNITSLRGLEEVCGSRLASRIWNWSKVITFNGKDRRSDEI